MPSAPNESGGSTLSNQIVGSAVTPDEYNTFLSQVDLRAIRLSQCAVDARARYDGATLIPNVQEGETTFDLTNGGFVVLHELIFTGKPEHNDGCQVSIRASFELEYTAGSQMTAGLFGIFKHHNLPVNVWPFFREFVHTVLARANWPVFLLPALQIPAAQRPRRVRATPEAESVTG